MATERAMLELSGELGYAEVTVDALLARSGSNRARFYASFGDKDRCYLRAYESAMERLLDRLLGACREAGDWRTGARLALVELGRFIAEDRRLAAGMIVAVHSAGTAVLERREEALGRLALAVDRARQEGRGGGQSPPPATARFALGSCEAALVLSFEAVGTSDREVLSALLYLLVAPYFGPEAALREAARLG